MAAFLFVEDSMKSFMKTLMKICKGFSRQVKEDNLNAYASSCAFFIFLSIIPIIVLLLAILPYTPISSDLILDWIQKYLPAGTGTVLASVITDAYSKSIGLISVAAITTLWSAGKGVNSLITGFNAIDKVYDKRNSFVLRLFSSLYTLIFLVAIVVLLLVVVGGNVAEEFLVGFFPKLSTVFGMLVNFRSLISLVMMTLIFMVCYAFLPYKKHKFSEQIPGAIFSALGWTGFSFLFSFYVEKFNAFSMYGSLTTIIVLLFWLYTCLYIVFIGANLNRYFRPVISVLHIRKGSMKVVKGQLESLEE